MWVDRGRALRCGCFRTRRADLSATGSALWPDRRSWHHRVRPSSVETDAQSHRSTVATAATLTRSHVLLRAGLRAVSRCTAPRMVTAPSQIMNAPYPPSFQSEPPVCHPAPRLPGSKRRAD
jgi:hypothetical protein